MNSEASWIHVRALSAVLAASLAACGGGGDSDSPSPPPPPPPSSVQLAGKAVDGPLQGATACYDTNNNKACDSGEPASNAASDANGNFTIDVPTASAGQHRMIVNVPATAIDLDTGAAVGTAFTLIAPASGTAGAQSVFVSPLTTLVQQHMDASGQALAQARDFIQAQAGLGVSPLADFTAAVNADNTKAANAAKLVLQSSQQQAAAVAAAVGQTDVSGAVITQADMDKAVLAKVTSALPSIGAQAADPALAGLTGASREQALVAAAAAVVAGIGFNADQAKFEVGLPKLPALPQPATTQAGANLAAVRYVSASNWFLRYNASTAADNVPDGNGLLRYYGVRTQTSAYAYQPDQVVAESAVRTFNPEVHWSGTVWGNCELGDRDTTTVRDAAGRSSFTSCNNHEKGFSQRAEIDIAGQTLASVWTDKLLPALAKTNAPTNWSLSDVALLGSAVYPAGSRLLLQSNTVTEAAPTYDTSSSNRVTVFSDAVAQGGDARTGSVACSSPGTALPATSLEELVARYPGKRCTVNPGTNSDGSSLNPNEGWGATTVSLGALVPNGVTLPPGTGNYYSTNARYRVAFTGANNATTYYRCLDRRVDSSTRNCTAIGSGTYSIATLGDARVMSFANLPAEAQKLSSTRVFVERGGAVYFGYKVKVGAVSTTVRLNLPAANAFLGQLGLPVITPTEAPQALTGAKATNAATMKGIWYFSDDIGTGILRAAANGEYLSAITDAPNGNQRPGYERGWLEVDAAGKMSRLIALDTDGNSGFSHTDPSATYAFTSNTFTETINGVTEGFDGRLPDDGTGIVGMWAAGSPTDLKVAHVVFFANGKALGIHPAETTGPCATARKGPPGIEWSDYSYNPATGAVRFFNKVYDSTGCTGLFDSADAQPNTEATLVLTFSADRKTATVPIGEGTGTLTLYRIAPR